MNLNFSTLSNRAREIITNKKFYRIASDLNFTIELGDCDKILTVFHHIDCDYSQLLFNEVICLFSQNKTLSEVWGLNFREIESYLRDENHLPAFAGDYKDIEYLFIQSKLSFLAAGFRSKLGSSLFGLKAELSNWKNLKLVARNRWAISWLSALSWELILCEENLLTISTAPIVLSNDHLEVFLSEVLDDREKLLPFKVVAV